MLLNSNKTLHFAHLMLFATLDTQRHPKIMLQHVATKAWERDPLIRALQCLYRTDSAADAEQLLHLSPWSADEEASHHSSFILGGHLLIVFNNFQYICAEILIGFQCSLPHVAPGLKEPGQIITWLCSSLALSLVLWCSVMFYLRLICALKKPGLGRAPSQSCGSCHPSGGRAELAEGWSLSKEISAHRENCLDQVQEAQGQTEDQGQSEGEQLGRNLGGASGWLMCFTVLLFALKASKKLPPVKYMICPASYTWSKTWAFHSTPNSSHSRSSALDFSISDGEDEAVAKKPAFLLPPGWRADTQPHLNVISGAISSGKFFNIPDASRRTPPTPEGFWMVFFAEG